MEYWLTRTELLIGKENIEKLANSHVLVAGLGGVGAYAAEQICRAGVGKMTIVDSDVVNLSNCNRQLIALTTTVGKSKAELMKERLLQINPNLQLNALQIYLKDEKIPDLLNSDKFDYVVDAIDTLSPKLYFIVNAYKLGLPIVSSMGAGGKFDPTQIRVSDISETYNCKLAYYIRKKIHKFDIYKGFKAVFSAEEVDRSAIIVTDNEQNKKSTVGTISYMPAVFGCTCASVVIRDLIGR